MLKPVLMLALVLSITPSFAQAAKCPVINGKFARIVERDGKFYRQTYYQYTRVERGVFSYNVNKDKSFQVADGIPRPIRIGDQEGKISVLCGNNSVLLVSKVEDAEPYRIEVQPVDNDKIQVTESDPARSGIYSIVL